MGWLADGVRLRGTEPDNAAGRWSLARLATLAGRSRRAETPRHRASPWSIGPRTHLLPTRHVAILCPARLPRSAAAPERRRKDLACHRVRTSRAARPAAVAASGAVEAEAEAAAPTRPPPAPAARRRTPTARSAARATATSAPSSKAPATCTSAASASSCASPSWTRSVVAGAFPRRCSPTSPRLARSRSSSTSTSSTRTAPRRCCRSPFTTTTSGSWRPRTTTARSSSTSRTSSSSDPPAAARRCWPRPSPAS